MGGVIAQEERATEELMIHVYNEPAYHITYFKISLESDVCWDAFDGSWGQGYEDYHPINYYYGSEQATQPADTIQHNKIVEWRACWANRDVYTEHRFGLGRYKIIASYDSDFETWVDWLTIDWRTSLLSENFNNGDIDVWFDVSTNKFYWDHSRQVPINKGSYKWAELKGLETNVTIELEPKTPSSFELVNYNNYPKLSWTKPYSDFVTDYEIYRKVGKFGFFQKIATISGDARSFIDYDYVVGKSIKLTYKIRAKNGSGATAYSEFTDEKYIYGDFYKEGSDEIRYVFNLAQNYPNPFNPTTTITYSVPDKMNVTLTVYNALGKEIKVLVNEEKDAGLYSIDFYAENLPSGIYFYTISAGENADTKKLLLIK